MIEPDKWDSHERWRRQLEKRLNELGSAVRGNQAFQAERISDLLELIEELRADLTAVKERQDRIAKYVKENVNHRVEEK